MTKLLGLLFIASSALTACADSNEEFADAATGLEGIYKVATYTRNDTACTPGGSSVLGNDGYAVAVMQEVLGHQMLTLTSCASPLDCRKKVDAMHSRDSFSIEFQFTTYELDDDALTGHGAWSGSLENGRCVGGERNDTRLVRSEGLLTVEQKITPADAYQPEDGLCWTDGATRGAEGNSCTALELLTAEFVEMY
jgi:uncharacterized membrane protein